MAEEIEIGVVSIFFLKPSVAAIKLTGDIKVGDTIHIKGMTTDFEQTIDSMQSDHKSVEIAKSGDDIGIKVKDRVRRGDKVFLVK
jgi:translation elongation factor EF-1alpha